MPPEEFKAVFRLINAWIDDTLASYKGVAESVDSLEFKRLPKYFSSELLGSAKVVLVDRVPVPPLSSLGLSQFTAFENSEYDGITYKDTFFVKRTRAQSESLHFHELVHVIQWGILGPEQFLAFYADGLAKYGYRHSPLEVMAYDAQAAFDDESQNAFSVEAMVADKLQAVK